MLLLVLMLFIELIVDIWYFVQLMYGAVKLSELFHFFVHLYQAACEHVENWFAQLGMQVHITSTIVLLFILVCVWYAVSWSLLGLSWLRESLFGATSKEPSTSASKTTTDATAVPASTADPMTPCDREPLSCPENSINIINKARNICNQMSQNETLTAGAEAIGNACFAAAGGISVDKTAVRSHVLRSAFKTVSNQYNPNQSTTDKKKTLLASVTGEHTPANGETSAEVVLAPSVSGTGAAAPTQPAQMTAQQPGIRPETSFRRPRKTLIIIRDI